ncbi:N-acetylmuramoyl-L-alanine amidase [Paracidovorax avenae]|uniref:peptidoglycan recognition protein family protein n=1 Tax=Paracidovorax avenae TaxID=80867 RepID=UPI000D155BF2|nr:N-acetylmuramoyl-L-alanine amidase [Paracidovorax avenae]AVS77219.1 N-acetylmuramoyl-L-alanine amidase [Paracidovorax avenae]AVS80435.1 N-acetylmuramoyl-L-alanine amidase [Paracidovorax avenae]AVS98311.1 N-acetylmuramoyl-L-alanine amidase [Paracidovorax avenae]AVT15673.1 N-acetylmuramoyl-L-alanine amidase [Paracidovorax avenae]
MLFFDTEGMVVRDPKIRPYRFTTIERTAMQVISGIIVHQTGAATEKSTFNSYRLANANGAHFLILKDGTIYQTASVFKRTNHVGPLRARCLAEHRCTPSEIKTLKTATPTTTHRIEMQKVVPGRYPSNSDSIGIEIVGLASLPPGVSMPPGLNEQQQRAFMGNRAVFEPLTSQQQASLRYLVDGLTKALRIPSTEIHKHPDVSRKNATEAATASWQ